MIGFQSGNLAGNISGVVFIGSGVGRESTVSNRLMIHNSQTETPLLDGDFSGETLTINGDLNVRGDPVQPSATSVLLPTNGAVSIDWTASTVFTHAINGDSTYTISNQIAGQTISISITASANATPTFTGVLWAEGSAPGQIPSGQTWVVTIIYDGVNLLGIFQENFS